VSRPDHDRIISHDGSIAASLSLVVRIVLRDREICKAQNKTARRDGRDFRRLATRAGSTFDKRMSRASILLVLEQDDMDRRRDGFVRLVHRKQKTRGTAGLRVPPAIRDDICILMNLRYRSTLARRVNRRGARRPFS
jgi:hypothetical protein